MKHMDEGLLQAWLDGPRAGLTEEERTRVEEHVAQCPVCAERLETLRATSVQASELLAAVEEPEDEIPPFDAVLRRAGELNGDAEAPPPDPAPTPVRPWWGRRTAWAASILVALGAGWLANEWNTTTPDFRLDPLQVTEGPASFEAAQEAVEEGAEEGVASADRTDAEPGALDRSVALSVEPSPETGPVAAERRVAEAPASAGEAAAPAADASRTSAEREARLVPPPVEPDPVVRLQVAVAPPRTAIRGRVVDEATGRPLESVQVSIPGTSAGTLTNADGRFLLFPGPAVDSAAELLLALEVVGYRQAELALERTGDEVEVGEVGLAPMAVALDELVVANAVGGVETAEVEEAAATVSKGLADDRWVPASMDQARDHLGVAIGTVAGLPVGSVHVGIFDGVPAVRMEQVLEGGVLTLIQSRVPVLVGPDGADRGMTVQTGDGLQVTGWAELPADSLRVLMSRVR